MIDVFSMRQRSTGVTGDGVCDGPRLPTTVRCIPHSRSVQVTLGLGRWTHSVELLSTWTG